MTYIKICLDKSFISNDDKLAEGFDYERLAEHLCSVFPEINSYEYVDYAYYFVEYCSDEYCDENELLFDEYVQTLDLDQFF